MPNISFQCVFFHGSVNNENALFIRRAGFLRITSLSIADGWGRVLCAHSHTHTYIYTCVKQITAEKLLHNTGSPAGCSVMTSMSGTVGREAPEEDNVCIIMADLHCCKVETNTLL